MLVYYVYLLLEKDVEPSTRASSDQRSRVGLGAACSAMLHLKMLDHPE